MLQKGRCFEQIKYGGKDARSDTDGLLYRLIKPHYMDHCSRLLFDKDRHM